MAGTLTVQNIQGPTSGANANKIIVPSGQTFEVPSGAVLDASGGTLVPSAGQVVQTTGLYTTSNFQLVSTSTSFSAVDASMLIAITPQQSNSVIRVVLSYSGFTSSGNYLAVQMYNKVNSGSYTSSGSGEPTWIGDGWHQTTFDRLCNVTYALGDTITFQPYFRAYSSATSIYFGWGATVGSEVTMYAQEIAQ